MVQIYGLSSGKSELCKTIIARDGKEFMASRDGQMHSLNNQTKGVALHPGPNLGVQVGAALDSGEILLMAPVTSLLKTSNS